MKRIWLSSLFIMAQGCASVSNNTVSSNETSNNGNPLVESTSSLEQSCVGSPVINGQLGLKFDLIKDEELLSKALGEPNQGKLCQGKVYQSNQEVTIYRAWNSTNPHSQFGQWWAFERPSGLTADYRTDYEICYQWSPLDKMVKCTLKPGTQVVVGNGQSAKCSEYLTYPSSEKQQVFIVNAADAVLDCKEYDSVMSWK
ncbi:hypothetical protein [Litoribacillus peritrichatus]|uniref:Lipoprotein n=1 Tax=Litoribacillus peritrichatus TaxID=718191 RepID=A0ABP7N859_9GAMM